MIAMARDGLAALDDPAASAFPRGISYASPRDPCQLVTASTRARYAGGATGQQQSGGGVIGSGESSDSTCAWFAPDGALFMDATIYTSIDNAQGDISPASSSRGIIPAASSRDHSR
jgi:hypothetical protein